MPEEMEIVVVATEDLPAGFKVTELGPLPEEWDVVRLGNVSRLTRKGQGTPPNSADVIPFIPMALLPDDGLYVNKWDMRAHGEVRSGILISEGDFLLAKITPSFENGKQGIVTGIPGGWGYATTEVIPIRPLPNLLTEFMAYYLNIPRIRQTLAHNMEGTTGRRRLPKEAIENLYIPLPPLPEQRAIAHVLRTVQLAKEATEKVIAAARELKKSLMRHLFTYGPVSIAEANRVPLKETEIGPLPEHWRVVRLGDAVQKTNQLDPGRMPNRVFKYVDVSSVDNQTLRIIRYQHFPGGQAPSRARKIVRTGDVLFATVRPYLKRVALVPREFDGHLCSTAFCVLRATTNVAIPEHLFFSVSTDQFVSAVSEEQRGSSYPAVTDGDVLRKLIPLPPLPEQAEIVRLLTAVGRKIQVEEARLQAVDALFQTLLHHLMTGKVRVKDLALPDSGGVA